jgi:hypothetical protein
MELGHFRIFSATGRKLHSDYYAAPEAAPPVAAEQTKRADSRSA